jgi:hypothetical protein
MTTKIEAHTKEVALHIYIGPPSSYRKEEIEAGYSVSISDFKYSDDYQHERVFLSTYQAQVPIPAKDDIAPALVAALKDKQSKLRADTEKKCEQIDLQISHLQLISSDVIEHE